MAETSVAPNNRAVSFRGKVEREMPLESGSSQPTISRNISELHSGGTYARTAKKFGKAKANKQAVAIALSKARETRKHAKGAMKRGLVSEKAAKRHLSGA